MYGDYYEVTAKAEYTYDENDDIILFIYSYYDSWLENPWVFKEKCEFAYDADRNNTLFAYYWYNDADWRFMYKYEYEYNANGNLTMRAYYTSDGWADKCEYEYDVNENTTTEVYSQKFSATDDWDISYKKEYAYDYSYSKTNLVCPFNYLGISINNMLTESKYYPEGGEIWNSFATYHWSPKEIEVGIKETISQSSFTKLYPNPVSNTLYIESNSAVLSEVKIYSIQGVLLLHTKGNQIDVVSLTSGIYIAVIDGVSRKIVKQ